MDFPGPILAIGKITAGPMPRTSADPKCLIVEVKTPTSMNQFVELQIARTAVADLVAKLTNILNDPDIDSNTNILA